MDWKLLQIHYLSWIATNICISNGQCPLTSSSDKFEDMIHNSVHNFYPCPVVPIQTFMKAKVLLLHLNPLHQRILSIAVASLPGKSKGKCQQVFKRMAALQKFFCGNFFWVTRVKVTNCSEGKILQLILRTMAQDLSKRQEINFNIFRLLAFNCNGCIYWVHYQLRLIELQGQWPEIYRWGKKSMAIFKHGQ